MTLLQLLFSFLRIGLLSIGDGYATLPVIQDQVVTMHGWLNIREFVDILAISQMTPGPIAINAVSFVETKIAGLSETLVASLGVVLPSFIIILTLSSLYYKYRQLDMVQAVLKGLRPAVVTLIASAGVFLGIDAFWGGRAISFVDVNPESVLLLAPGFSLLRKHKKSPTTVVLLCGVLVAGYGLLSESLTFQRLLHA